MTLARRIRRIVFAPFAWLLAYLFTGGRGPQHLDDIIEREERR